MKVISKKIELKKIQKQKIRKVAKFPNSHIFFKAMVCLYKNQLKSMSSKSNKLLYTNKYQHFVSLSKMLMQCKWYFSVLNKCTPLDYKLIEIDPIIRL